MALELKVHWREKPLQVDFHGGDFHGEIGRIRTFGSSHVRPVGNDVLVENFFGEKNRVLDVSRYHIDAIGCIVRHDDICGLELKKELRKIGSIVLLLESPHRDEYTEGNVYDINRPLAPANGESGRKIDQHLHEVLSHIDDLCLIVPGRHVIISNPIPFQTSLPAVHHKSLKDDKNCRWATLRDYVWLTLWNEQRIQQSFRARLNRYNPSLIINACTAGVKNRVCTFVRQGFPNVIFYNVGHPAFWHVCKNRTPKRICPQADPKADDQ